MGNAGAQAVKLVAPATRSIPSVEILAVGSWVSWSGDVVVFDHAELGGIVDRFRDSTARVPLKVGHTSDPFNKRIAEALGVPLEAVIGEDGNGQLALGEAVNLTVSGDKLLADFVGVPEPIADMILMKGSGFTNVSAEIEYGRDADGRMVRPVITAIALLGAESPSIGTLAGLYAFVSISGRRQMVTLAKNGNGLTANVRKEQIMLLEQEIRQALGVDDKADVLATLLLLKAKAEVPAPVPKPLVFSESAEYKTMAEQVAQLQAANQKLGHERRVAHYIELANGWVHLPKSALEVGEELAKIEESVNVATAGMIVAQHAMASEALKKAGLFTPFSTPQSGAGVAEKHPFEAKVEAHAAKQGVTFQKALSVMASEDPEGWTLYRRENPAPARR